MHSLPIAAVAHYHTFSMLQLWGSEVQNGFHWADIKVSADLHSLLEIPGENSFPGFSIFQMLLLSLVLLLQSQQHWLSPPATISWDRPPLPLLSTFKGPGDYIGPT